MKCLSVTKGAFIASALGLLLSACGGGGTGSNAALPRAPGPQVDSVAVQFSILIPQSAARVPKYISAGTKSAVITVVQCTSPSSCSGPTVPPINCTTSCSATVNAPVGSDTFTVTLYDTAGGTGNILSRGSTTQTIVAGQANSVNVTFGGVVATIGVALASATISSAGSDAVTVTAKDAANNTIVGAANYDNPITLSLTDSTHTSLNTTSVTSPSTSVSLTYDGSSAFSATTINATATNVSPSAVTTATLTKIAGTTSPAAAFLTQTSSVKVNGIVATGISGALAIAVSQTVDQAGNGQNGLMSLGSLNVGTGTSAQSVVRAPQSMGHAAVGVEWGPALQEHDGPDRSKQVADLLARVPRPVQPASATRHTRTSTIPPGPLTVGASTASIWAQNSSIGSNSGTYTQVPATLEAQTAHGNIWVDNTLLTLAAFSSSLTSTRTALANDFENAYVSDTTHFATADYPTSAPGFSPIFSYYNTAGAVAGTGPLFVAEPSDNRINVLVVNPSSLGSGVGGYFDATNYIPQTLWNYFGAGPGGGTRPMSNEAPFIYVGWSHGDTLTTYELQEDLVRGMSHELQHLINFVNHSILAPAAATYPCTQCNEDAGINEGLSMLSQDLAVNRMFSAVPLDVADAMGHANLFLKAPQNFSVTGFIGIDPASVRGDGVTPAYNCSGCYGAAYLWQRYLRDRFGGDTYTRGMETSGTVGYANLAQNAGGETAPQLLGDFALAMGANSQGVTTTGAFNFGTFNVNGSYTDQFGNARTLAGVAATALPANSSLAVTPPFGGFAFVSLTSIPAGGEPLSIVDTGTGSTFGLVGGLIQH